MAGLDGAITMAMERRPCYVDGKKAMFHCWASITWKILPGYSGGRADQTAQFVPNTMAIVEYEDGTVDTITPLRIRFADGGDFAETAWEEVRTNA